MSDPATGFCVGRVIQPAVLLPASLNVSEERGVSIDCLPKVASLALSKARSSPAGRMLWAWPSAWKWTTRQLLARTGLLEGLGKEGQLIRVHVHELSSLVAHPPRASLIHECKLSENWSGQLLFKAKGVSFVSSILGNVPDTSTQVLTALCFLNQISP